jgi:hypothetical protein
MSVREGGKDRPPTTARRGRGCGGEQMRLGGGGVTTRRCVGRRALPKKERGENQPGPPCGTNCHISQNRC